MPPWQALLERWIEESGGHLGSLEIRSQPDGERAVHASRAIQAGELLLEVPACCMVTPDAVGKYRLGRRVAEGWPGGKLGQIGHAVFLLEQRLTGDRWWSPFIASLPNQWHHLPLFYRDQDMRLLDGSAIPLAIARRKVELGDEFVRLVGLAPELGSFSVEDYFCARAASTTRAFADRRGGHPKQTLVPMADMLNHSLCCESAWLFDGERNVFCLHGKRAVKGGEPVHTDYGSRSNTHFLQNYGFTLAGNPHDEAAIWVAPPQWGPETDRRSREFGELESGRRRFQLPRRGPKGTAVISFFRLAFARGDELQRAMQSGTGEIPVLSERNESAVMEALGEACRNALRRYPSSVEEDDGLLMAGVTGNARNCIVARRGEKAVLRAWAEWAERGPFAAYEARFLEGPLTRIG
jgi:histone-lysine N-methyltransferase SETD3